MSEKLKALLVINECNPEWLSFPLLGYHFFRNISQLVDVTLVTSARNQRELKKVADLDKIIFVEDNLVAAHYFSFIGWLTRIGRGNIPLRQALSYPAYAAFDNRAYELVKKRILRGDYDVVHALTPGTPRYPYKVVKACQRTPFLLGPVNGGLPFPKGFEDIARLESAHFNFLRAVGRVLIPGYVETYKKADLILTGAVYTKELVMKLFKLPSERIRVFSENGVPENFFSTNERKNEDGITQLLFVGRLEPFKCADIVVEAFGRLPASLRAKAALTIVGFGSEEVRLKKMAAALCPEGNIRFHGQTTHKELVDFYKKADIFCFPSIREYGGAVVLEAMANGLPCIVTDYGGIGEYVTAEAGFKIEPLSKEHLTKGMTEKMKLLIEDGFLRKKMSAQAIQRAREYAWENKAKQIVGFYHEMIEKKKGDLEGTPK